MGNSSFSAVRFPADGQEPHAASRSFPARNRRALLRYFGGPDAVWMEHAAAPAAPGAGQVLIRVEASGCGATDTVIRKGIYPLIKEAPPFVLGYEFVGILESAGAGVDPAWVGRRVADIVQIGANADFIVRPAKDLIEMDADIDAGFAASLPLAHMTAYQMLHRVAKVREGDVILVHGGSGAVGSALLQLAALHGVRVVSTASAGKLEHVRALGAVAIDYQEPGLQRLLAAAAPQGYDAVFDPLGPQSFARSFRLLKPTGQLVTYATM